MTVKSLPCQHRKGWHGYLSLATGVRTHSESVGLFCISLHSDTNSSDFSGCYKNHIKTVLQLHP